MPLWKVYQHLLSLFLLVICVQSSEGKGEEVKGVLGGVAKLPCEVNKEKCGETFSITWAKQISNDWKRVYFMDGSTSEKAMQVLDFAERAKWVTSNYSAHLVISSLRLEDEGLYRCDVTYTEPCPSLTFSSLVIQVKPTHPEIKQDGKVIDSDDDADDIGPFDEGEELTLSCESRDGKPTAEIRWLKDGDVMDFDVSTTENSYGSEDVEASIRLELTREDSGAVLTCEVENEALEETLTSLVKIGLRLKPLSLNVSGPTEPVLEGETIELTCVVEGARPEAEIAWYNVSEMIHSSSEPDVDEMEDDTFRTSSELEIVVTRYDNEGTYICKGTNEVLQDSGEEPLMKSVRIQVEYPPIVTIQPEGGIIVNETKDAVLSCSFDANPPDIHDVVWYKDFEELDVEDNDNYTVSFDKVPKLTIHDVRRDERGVFSCALKNKIGGANSTNAIEMSVLYPPIVKAIVSPSFVDEGEDSTVSLRCKIEKGNPQNLLDVRWYKDGKFLSETTDSMSWRGVIRNMTGNYSCDARTDAGWGDISEPDELIVRYLPGEANISELDAPSIKGEPTILICDVDELGLPEADIYAWELDGELIPGQNDDNYTIEEVDFDDQGNYSCYAINDVGAGPKVYYYLDAKAPPKFLISPRKEGGAARDATSYNITCQVECDPICDIEWFKDDESIMDSDLYDITEKVFEDDDNHDRFSSILSMLRWNMTAWPGGMLDRERDTANYTCRSTENEVGEGVEATTLFSVEYAPENIRVTQRDVRVEEGDVVEPINCSASSWPPSTYIWKYKNFLVSDTSLLDLGEVSRTENGTYVCVASNSRGQAEIKIFVNVLHAPECALSREEEDGHVVLICKGIANPDVMNFTWTKDDEEILEDVETEQTESVYKFSKMSVEYYGEYECVVRNGMGESEPCGLNVTVAIAEPWDPATGGRRIFVIAAVVGGIAILFLLVIVIIIFFMRRKRRTDASAKPPKPSEAVYQNIESADHKENGLSEPESKPMYENMPFFGRNKGPFRPDINDDLLYADMYDDVKLGKVPDPRMKPPLPPKGIGKKPKEPPLPPKTRKKAPSSDII